MKKMIHGQRRVKGVVKSGVVGFMLGGEGVEGERGGRGDHLGGPVHGVRMSNQGKP